MRSIKLWSAVFIIVSGVICTAGPSLADHLIKWKFPAKDINGRTITIDTFMDRVTVVSFSSQKSQERDMQLGQEIGQRFGHRSDYQSLVIPNTSYVPLWGKFVAIMKVAGAEKEAIREASRRQKANGNNLTEEEVRRRVIFVHDKDGKVWEYFGLDIDANRSFLGVIDRSGTLVYIEKSPINRDEFFRILEKEFDKNKPEGTP